jgi:spore coat protein U-like protein
VDPEVLGALTYLIVFKPGDGQEAEDSIRNLRPVERAYVSTSRMVGALVARVADPREIDLVSRRLEEAGCSIISVALVDFEHYSVDWMPERPREGLQLKCAFCDKPITGKPYTVTLEDGSTLLFNSRECARAYFTLKRA